MATFKAIVIDKTEPRQKSRARGLRRKQPHGRRRHVQVEWSTLNYKDGLAITGKAPVVRRFPMIAGIDFAGTVESSRHPAWQAGDRVILNGWGCGETHLGGYGEKARVKGDWLVRTPASMSARDAMTIGTAGYTAMLALLALEHHGVSPARGPVVVTGAAGGVGSVAVAILSRRGFQVTAVTGRPEEAGYLKKLGADEVIARARNSPDPRNHWQKNAGRAVSMRRLDDARQCARDDALRWSSSLRVDSPAAWICRLRWLHLSCAALRCSASTRSRVPTTAGVAWQRLEGDLVLATRSGKLADMTRESGSARLSTPRAASSRDAFGGESSSRSVKKCSGLPVKLKGMPCPFAWLTACCDHAVGTVSGEGSV